MSLRRTESGRGQRRVQLGVAVAPRRKYRIAYRFRDGSVNDYRTGSDNTFFQLVKELTVRNLEPMNISVF